MRDPQPDRARTPSGRREWLVVIGVCTWDNCVPFFAEGALGGWGCPCCGAVYDLSGRARAGPPDMAGRRLRNLAIPGYSFPQPDRIRILSA